MNNYFSDFFIPLVAAFLVGVVGFFSGLTIGHHDGYCAGKGGYYIADNKCDINGKVVKIDE